jgi:hypothetical protein
MKGCVLAGRFLFSDPAKNTSGAVRRKSKLTGKTSRGGKRA